MSGPLRKYKVKRGGVETVMKLSDDDAKRLGVGVDQAVDAAPTIEPVQPVDDGAAAAVADGPAPGEAAQPGYATTSVTTPVAEGAVVEQGSGDAAAADPETEQAPAKAPAKRRTTSANKARPAAETKAEPGGS
ncbi:hypothetical protein ABZ733_08465 [Streptomyces longwoodensis]|uniref:hypothetical protein n=1 Tax=Streptomyces longwoodensis TaxID=68231 RepID=UPI0033DC3EDC